MTAKSILKTAEKFVTENSPGILTGLGVAGAVSTAVLAAKGGFRASEIIQREFDAYPAGPDAKEKFQLVWKEFIPAGAIGIVTVSAIIGANKIGARRAAAIAAAFKISEQLSEEYKQKVVETLGLQKEEKLRSELAADKMEQNPPPSSMLIVAGSDVLFFDEMSGRYFHNQVENVKKAVNDINYKVNNYHCASLTDFYEMIGLDETQFSGDMGWNTDELLDVKFAPVMVQDKPAISISYSTTPTRGYDRCQ
jgi:hypothetical protein